MKKLCVKDSEDIVIGMKTNKNFKLTKNHIMFFIILTIIGFN